MTKIPEMIVCRLLCMKMVQVATRHPPLQGFLWIGGASWMLTYIPVTPS